MSLSIEPDAHAPAIPISTDTRPDRSAPWSLYTPVQRIAFLSILFLVTTSNFFDNFVIAVLLDPIKAEFHVSDTMLGLLSGLCFTLIYALAAFPIARWADRGNRVTVMTLTVCGWSLMTALCGLAQSFAQLAMARFGVGVFEPGALPTAQSLIADYFPPERRARAISILVGGASAVGWLIGIGVGGFVAARYGWRMAFFTAAVPGLLLTIVVRVYLREPRLITGFPQAIRRAESFVTTVSQLAGKKSFVWLLLGASTYTIFALGITVFVPSFMVRSFHTTLDDVSLQWGAAIATSNIVGAFIGGRIADHLCPHEPRWYAWLPATSCAVALPLYLVALTSRNLWVFISVEFVAELILSIGIPIVATAILAVSGRNRRSTSAALQYCVTALVGATLGPFLAGLISDAFSSKQGADSLRYSLIVMCVFLVPASALLYNAARSLVRDLED